MERDHAKEKQKLVKDKDAGQLLLSRCFSWPYPSSVNPSKAKGQLTKANQTKAKMENLARELQKVLLTEEHDLYSPTNFYVG